MLGLKLKHVSKRGHWSIFSKDTAQLDHKWNLFNEDCGENELYQLKWYIDNVYNSTLNKGERFP